MVQPNVANSWNVAVARTNLGHVNYNSFGSTQRQRINKSTIAFLIKVWEQVPGYPCCSMGKGRNLSKRAAVHASAAHMASFEGKKPGKSFRGQQEATILAGLRALKAPAVSQLL